MERVAECTMRKPQTMRLNISAFTPSEYPEEPTACHNFMTSHIGRAIFKKTQMHFGAYRPRREES